MRPGQLPCDRQPQPRPSPPVEAHEALEGGAHQPGREPGAVVGHRELDAVVVGEGQGDLDARSGVAQGVVEEIAEDLASGVAVEDELATLEAAGFNGDVHGGGESCGPMCLGFT